MEVASLENNIQNEKKIYESIGIPQSIKKKENSYTFKTVLNDNKNYIYRCKLRKFKAPINIDKDNILKLLSQNKEININYRVGKKNYTCIYKSPKIQITQKDLILTNNEINDRGDFFQKM